MTRELNGRHVALIFGTALATIIGVNAIMAFQAIKTFPGLEVKNSYVASQNFDRERTAQEALGWTVDASVVGEIILLRIEAADGPADAHIVEARVGRKTYSAEDREVSFRRDGDIFVAEATDLEPGGWTLWLAAEAADGTQFRQRLSLVRKLR